MIVLFFVKISEILDSFSSFLSVIFIDPVVGMLILCGCYVGGITLMIPTSLILFAIGIECHKLLGTAGGYFVALALSVICTVLGCTLAFLLSRYLLKQAILSQIKPNWYRTRAILSALEHNGVKLVILFRLAPIFPFSLLNYALGASSVRLLDYIIGSIGLIPKLALYIYISVSISSINQAVSDEKANSTQLIIILSIGAFFSILAAVYMTIIARRELNKILDDSRLVFGETQEPSISDSVN